MRGIRMMCIAIKKAQQSPTQLTSIHSDLAQVRFLAEKMFTLQQVKVLFCNSVLIMFSCCTQTVMIVSNIRNQILFLLFSWQLCLLAKCLKPALPFLDTDITDIHKEVDHYVHEWPRENFWLQYQFNIKQTHDENKEKHQLRDDWLIKYQILQTNKKRTVWQTAIRVDNGI